MLNKNAFEDDFYSDCESTVEYNKKLNSAKINYCEWDDTIIDLKTSPLLHKNSTQAHKCE